MILVLVFAQPSYESFAKTAFSFLVLLAMQFTVFFFFPVKIPNSWRVYNPNGSLSLRMLAFVHSFDKMVNSIPSMHVSVATLTALHLQLALAPHYGGWAGLAYLFPAAHCAECALHQAALYLRHPAGRGLRLAGLVVDGLASGLNAKICFAAY